MNVNMQKFYEEVCGEIAKLLTAEGIAAETKVMEFTRTNEKKIGISVLREGSSTGPVFYLKEENFFQSPEEVAENLFPDVQHYLQEAPDNSIENIANELKDPEKLKKVILESVTLSPVNKKKNEELLKKVPHEELGDLAAVPIVILDKDAGASLYVTNDMLKVIGMTKKELLTLAREHTEKLPFQIISMADILGMPKAMWSEFPLWILQTKRGFRGADVIFSKEALAKMKENFDGNLFYILPSSVHEVICCPTGKGMSAEDLKEIVHSVNTNELDAAEFLSDSVMLCDGEHLEFSLSSLDQEEDKER